MSTSIHRRRLRFRRQPRNVALLTAVWLILVGEVTLFTVLGGALLARQVGEGLPRGYLATPLPKGAWRKLLAKLDESLYPGPMRDQAIRSALSTFALFEASGRAALAR